MSPFLKIVTTRARNCSAGIVSEDHHSFIISRTHVLFWGLRNLNNSAVISSGPAALLLLAFLIAKLSSSNVKSLVLKPRLSFSIFPLPFSGGSASAFHCTVCK